MTQKQAKAKIELVRRRCKKPGGFKFFVNHVFKASFEHFITGEYIDFVADRLEAKDWTMDVTARDHFKSTRLYAEIMYDIFTAEKDINERMASTVRHNRARGKHSVAGMSTIVFDMLQNGKSDQEICKELGLEAEELARLKHITGFSKLFEDVEYGKSWETDKQLKYKKEWKEKEKKNGNAHEQTDTDKAE